MTQADSVHSTPPTNTPNIITFPGHGKACKFVCSKSLLCHADSSV